MALGERDRAVIDVERTWWLDGRTKAEVVRARLALSMSRYNELLAHLVAGSEAEDYDPLVVRRVRRAKDRRRWALSGTGPLGGRRHR